MSQASRDFECYLLWPMTDEPVQPDGQWLARFLAAHEFPCGHLDGHAWPDPVVVEHPGQNVPLTFVSRIHVQCIRSDLADVLSPEIMSHCTFGKLVDQAGTLIAAISSFRTSHQVWLRGGAQSYCWRCLQCHQLVYNPMGSWYILRSEVPSAPLFATHYGGLVVHSALGARFAGRRWSRTSVRPLRVLDKPLDGFPLDLREMTIDLERRWSPDQFSPRQ